MDGPEPVAPCALGKTAGYGMQDRGTEPGRPAMTIEVIVALVDVKLNGAGAGIRDSRMRCRQIGSGTRRMVARAPSTPWDRQKNYQQFICLLLTLVLTPIFTLS